MVFEILIVIFFLLVYVIVAQNFQISTFYIVFISLLTTIVGNLLIENDFVWIYNLIGAIILFGTYNFFRKHRLVLNKKDELDKKSEKKNDTKINKMFVYIIVFFVIYHYLVGGIPILNSNVEITRFEFTNSGLFGIPGRMVQYGIYFLVFYTGYFYFRENKCKKYFIFSIIVFLICKLFSGFKGALYDVLTMYVYILALQPKDVSIKKFFTIKFLIMVLVAVSGAGVMLSLYAVSKKIDNIGIYLLDRLTVIQAEAGHFLMTTMKVEDNYFYNDFVYYIRKYIKIDLDSSTGGFPLEKIISALINNVPLSIKYYIVPVTIGFFNELCFNISFYGALFFTGIIGSVYGYSERKMKKEIYNPFIYASLGLFIYMINLYISKGGMMYYIVNYILIIGLLYVFYLIGSYLKWKEN